MLNLVHHMMVQFAAFDAGKKNQFLSINPSPFFFDKYQILGDDLVIFDKEVAHSYLRLCMELGVSINLTKSIVSVDRDVVEFAKRTSSLGIDVSPLS
jgi:hypothetical protein